jgi:hypothetical protein
MFTTSGKLKEQNVSINLRTDCYLWWTQQATRERINWKEAYWGRWCETEGKG